jgi:drug/metabolite transporter (DMT)-like permease
MLIKAKNSIATWVGAGPSQERERGLGWFLALSSTLAAGIVTPLARSAIVNGVDPVILLLGRLLLAAILLVLTLAVFNRSYLRIDRQGLLRVMGIGLISGLEICCYFWALVFMDASMVAMIKSTQPLAVLLLLRLGGERLSRRHLMRLGLAFIGVYLLIGPGGQVAPFGVFLLFLSIILYALQLVFTQWYLDEYNSRTITIYVLVMMVVVVAGWWGLAGAVWRDPGPYGWLIIIILTIVSTYYARLALYAAVRRVGSGQLALLWPLQMMLGVVLSVLLLQERLSLAQWLGGGLILLSALLAVERLGPAARRWWIHQQVR